MKYPIRVKTNAKANAVTKDADGILRVSVKAPPREGRANEAVLEALAAYFRVPKSHVIILVGHGSKKKIVRIGN